MNQTEAAFKLANALKASERTSVGVNVVRPTEGDGSHSLIVSFPDGLFLSVTVEILAEP